MRYKILHKQGNNHFENNEFSHQEWSAPYVVSPEIIRELLSSFHLEGRRIKRMKMIGLTYNLRRDWIEEHAYNSLVGFPEHEMQEMSNYENISPETEYDRWAEIDEPFLIEFENGNVFEIDTPQVPEFRFSMNCIPWEIDAGCNSPNADANVIFAPALEKKILSIELKIYHSDLEPMYYTTYDEDYSSGELVSSIILWLENEIGIEINGWVDFCHVSLIDRSGKVLPILFGELKPALFNWEDLQ